MTTSPIFRGLRFLLAANKFVRLCLLKIELNYNQNFSSHINQSEIILDMTKCKFEVTMYTG